MNAIAEFKDHLSEDVTGIYRVTSVQSNWNDEYGSPCCKVKLADFTGDASVLASPAVVATAEKLRDGAIIFATIKPRMMSQMPGGTLTSLKEISASDVENIARVIPLTCCPSACHVGLNDLVSLLDRIQGVAIRKFVSTVLDSCYKNFVKAQGGWKHHHDFPGGLLAHSANVGLVTEYLATHVYPTDRGTVDVLVVAAILHDLGKADQIIRGFNHPVKSAIPHELITMQMVHIPLELFGESEPGQGRLLAEVVSWLARPPDARKKWHAAELIHFADAVDVKANKAAKEQADAATNAYEVAEAVSF